MIDLKHTFLPDLSICGQKSRPFNIKNYIPYGTLDQQLDWISSKHIYNTFFDYCSMMSSYYFLQGHFRPYFNFIFFALKLGKPYSLKAFWHTLN